jgi:hypothetical protein
MPYTVDLGYDFSKLVSSAYERPDIDGNPNQAGPVAANPTCKAPAAVHTVAHWYNPCAMMLPGATSSNLAGVPGTLGDMHRNVLLDPGYLGMDTSLQKTTNLTERLRMQLRFEAFNFINHTNLAQPGTNAFSQGSGGLPLGSAGAIISTIGTSRQLQFSAKFLF